MFGKHTVGPNWIFLVPNQELILRFSKEFRGGLLVKYKDLVDLESDFGSQARDRGLVLKQFGSKQKQAISVGLTSNGTTFDFSKGDPLIINLTSF